MGVPALFRWLSQKYPKIVGPVIEEQPKEIEGETVPVDITKSNPNGVEYDNLYLDMNGIVHPCSHPEDKPPPETEEEMMLEIFKYTERVFNMVRPRKLLMIAVDGVAPRAKMNQQRSRRFRSAQEAKEKDESNAEFIKMLKSQSGGTLEDGREEAITKKTWDSNQITPGTPFMFTLAACLRWWCAYKINTDPGWQNVKVLISDASVPGEGEHKIMEFIRSQRSSPLHDPNTRHVLYGLDADLIMLGLATHEPHFHVLREDVFFQEGKARTCRLCGQKGHMAEECQGTAKPKDGEHDEKDSGVVKKPFIWLHVSVLREYLAVELQVPGQPFSFDLERALDDWVFMCFFVGNDFLPHLPSLEIRENGIDTLIAIWRDNLPVMGGYLTQDGHVDLTRCQLIMNGLAKQEDAIFKRRRQTEERREANAKRRKMEDEQRNRRKSGRKSPDYGSMRARDGPLEPPAHLYAPGKGEVPQPITHDMVVNGGLSRGADTANKSAAAVLKSQLRGKESDGAEGEKSEAAQSTETEPSVPSNGVHLGKRKADLMEDDPSTPGRQTPITTDQAPAKLSEDEPPPDTVRLWEDGYADRYYEQKFHADPSDVAFRNKVAAAYVEGLAWVLLYYFQGCPSWRWYYPYHYAPFAADFVELDKMDIGFDKAAPLKPYEQLMGVLPAASNQAIPPAFRSLMENEDSEIIDFYPEDFHIDLNGKKWAWQGVAILPFIDEKRLLDAMSQKYPLLSEDEHARNETGKPSLIFSEQHQMFDDVAATFFSKRQGAPKFDLDAKKSGGLSGKVEKDPDYVPQSQLLYPLTPEVMPNVEYDHSICVHYEMPEMHHVHKSMLLTGVKLPKPTLDGNDIESTRGRASRTGRSFGGAPFRGGHRGGRGGRGGGRGGGFNYGPESNGSSRANPFAAHLDPGFRPPPFGGGPGPNMPHAQGSYDGDHGRNHRQNGYQQPDQRYHDNGRGGGHYGNGPSHYDQKGYGQGNSGGGRHSGYDDRSRNPAGGYPGPGGNGNFDGRHGSGNWDNRHSYPPPQGSGPRRY